MQKASPHCAIRKPAILKPSIRDCELLGRALATCRADIFSTPFPLLSGQDWEGSIL